jgi:hypothetical protein
MKLEQQCQLHWMKSTDKLAKNAFPFVHYYGIVQICIVQLNSVKNISDRITEKIAI